MGVTDGNSDYIPKIANLYRRVPVSPCPITKLAIIVIPPCPGTPIPLYGKGMESCGSSNHIAKTAYLYQGVPFSPCPITKLTVSIIPTCQDTPIILHCKGMVVSCGNSSHIV